MRGRAGQSLVEFALVLPLLAVIIFLITEFGRALYEYNVLTQATREGARRAVVSPEGNAVANGQAAMDSFLTRSGVNMSAGTVECEIQTIGGVTMVAARASKPFDWVLGSEPLPTVADGSNSVSRDDGLVLRGETIMKSEMWD